MQQQLLNEEDTNLKEIKKGFMGALEGEMR